MTKKKKEYKAFLKRTREQLQQAREQNQPRPDPILLSIAADMGLSNHPLMQTAKSRIVNGMMIVE